MCVVNKVPTPKPIMPPTPVRSNIDAENLGVRKNKKERDMEGSVAGAPSLRINLGSNPGSGANLG